MSGILDLRHIHWCIPNADFVASLSRVDSPERSIGMNERDEAMIVLGRTVGVSDREGEWNALEHCSAVNYVFQLLHAVICSLRSDHCLGCSLVTST
jgi:hypothetical protein